MIVIRIKNITSQRNNRVRNDRVNFEFASNCLNFINIWEFLYFSLFESTYSSENTEGYVAAVP